MSWHLLEKLLDEVSKQSTFVGKIWITLLFVFRIIAITRIADTVYADEQAAFKCNTKQPGCENVCFNDFSPISHVRFWGFQVIIVATPPMIFIVYALHIVAKLPNIFKLSGRHVEVVTFKSKKNLASSSKSSDNNNNKALSKVPTDDVIISSSRKQLITPGAAYRIHAPNFPPSRLPPRKGLCNVISFGYGRSTEDWDSDQESPPAYNHDPPVNQNYYREVPFDDVYPGCPRYETIPLHPWSYSSRDVESRFRNSEDSRTLPKPRRRRHSDSDLTPEKPRTRNCVRGGWSQTTSASSFDLSSHDDVTKRQYTAAEECSLNNIRSRRPSWNRTYSYNSPASALASPQSDKDSAFSEPSELSEKLFFRPALPPRLPANQHRAKQKRFMTSQARFVTPPVHRRLISGGELNKSPSFGGSPLKRTLPSSGRSSRVRRSGASPSVTSSHSKAQRAKAVIRKLEERIAVAYVFQCVVRLLLETAFLVLQYMLFRFTVPELYKCERWPCPNRVDCFVSRPQEKTTLLYFMFSVTALCIALTWYEIVTLIARFVKHARRLRKSKKSRVTSETVRANFAKLESDRKKGRRGDGFNDALLLDRYARYIKAKSGGFDSGSTTDTKTHTSSSESESGEDQESFNSEDLSSMFENDQQEDVGDFGEAAGAEGGDEFV